MSPKILISELKRFWDLAKDDGELAIDSFRGLEFDKWLTLIMKVSHPSGNTYCARLRFFFANSISTPFS